MKKTVRMSILLASLFSSQAFAGESRLYSLMPKKGAAIVAGSAVVGLAAARFAVKGLYNWWYKDWKELKNIESDSLQATDQRPSAVSFGNWRIFDLYSDNEVYETGVELDQNQVRVIAILRADSAVNRFGPQQITDWVQVKASIEKELDQVLKQMTFFGNKFQNVIAEIQNSLLVVHKINTIEVANKMDSTIYNALLKQFGIKLNHRIYLLTLRRYVRLVALQNIVNQHIVSLMTKRSGTAITS